MDRKTIAHLVHKLRTNEATKEERKAMEFFWQQAQDDRSCLDVLSEEDRQLLKLTMYEGIKAKIASLEGSSQFRQRVLPVSGMFLKIAASLAFIVILSFLWLRFGADQEQVLHTAYGEKLHILLPDSSRVIMNGNSTLRYSRAWGQEDDREVWIEGEAFFDVTHTFSNRKFIVHTSNGDNVQVLGTRFNVRIRRGKTQVMLEKGKVRFHVSRFINEETVYLVPGDLVSLEGKKLSKVKVNPLQYSGWKGHVLYFDHTELREVAEMLEDTYGLHVVFESEALAQRKLSGQIDSTTVTDILNAIGESLNIRFTQNGREVIFQSKE